MLCKCWHIRVEYVPDLKWIAPAIPEIWAFKKSLIFFFFLIFFFLHIGKKNYHKMQTHHRIAFKFSTLEEGYKAHIHANFNQFAL